MCSGGWWEAGLRVRRRKGALEAGLRWVCGGKLDGNVDDRDVGGKKGGWDASKAVGERLADMCGRNGS